jgi:hypothetical protein
LSPEERKKLEVKFDTAMLGVYQRAKSECKYNATVFLRMLHEHRGIETALRLVRAEQQSDGYTALYLCGRLDLTVEALVLQEPWRFLFDPGDLSCAETRLRKNGYFDKKGAIC